MKLCLLLLLLPIHHAAGACVWSDCINKANGFISTTCGSGTSSNGESRDCGEQSCVFGFCTYINAEYMCCPDNDACKWYESCNWAALTGYFTNATEHVKNTWATLSEGVQDKLTTAEKFANLTLSELTSLDSDLLSELKSVTGMTVAQFSAIPDKVHNMTASHLKDFLDNLSPGTFEEGLPSLGSFSDWGFDQVSKIKDRLASSDIWGNLSAWNASNIDTLGFLISNLDVDSIKSLANDALAHASSVSNLTSAQLSDLGSKLYSMSPGLLNSMLTKLNSSAFAESIGNITGGDYPWIEAQAVAFVEKLQQTDSWGNLSQWKAAHLGQLGSILPNLPVNLTTLLDDYALSHAPSLIKFGAEHLGKLGAKVFGLNVTNLQSMLDGVNSSALCGSLSGLTSTDYYWLPEQASTFQQRLFTPGACGSAVAWSKEQIGSLGSMLTSLNASAIKEFGNAALAHASNIHKLSAETIDALSEKIGSMDLSDFTLMVSGLNSTSLYGAMLSQCEVQCASDADLEFLRNPSSANAAAGLEAYAETVRNKASTAGLAYAKGFCSGGANQYDEVFAEVQAVSFPCNGSVAPNNTVRSTFESFSTTQAGTLVTRMTQSDSLGSLASWSEKQLTSLCKQYSALSPSNIAQISSSGLVAASTTAAATAALVAAFGPVAPVAAYAITQAADSTSTESRAAWAAKLKAGIGNLSSWGCEQVASMRSMVAGMDAIDLGNLSLPAIKGLVANAITAMNSSKVVGFSPTQIITMVEKVRKRLNGNLLRELNSTQIVAAVCGALNATGATWCPAATVDLTFGFPTSSVPSQAAIIAHFASRLNINASLVQVLWTSLASELPVTTATGRRLNADQTQVAVRVGVTDPSQQTSATLAAQTAANELASSNGGQVTEDALSLNTESGAIVTYDSFTSTAAPAATGTTQQAGGTPSPPPATTASSDRGSTPTGQSAVSGSAMATWSAAAALLSAKLLLV